MARYRCASCHSPVCATLGTQAAVPLALFARPHPDNWTPKHHMHYNDRVLDVPDGLLKYSGRFMHSPKVDDTGAPIPE